jgi:ABC-type transport system involved in multi-copper enzyme maturation permease subunit
MVASFSRVFAIAMNTYREAVRARVLLGLLAAALAASAYSLVIAAMSIKQGMRIVADIGSASISAFAVLVAIILGATSLYRELELKTVFPILTRQLRRHEYVVGKYLGILSVLFAFVAIDGASVLCIVAIQSEVNLPLTLGAAGALVVALVLGLWRAKLARVFVVLPWSILAFATMALVSGGAGAERQVVLVSACLTAAEIAIVTAIAMLFSSFSSPFLTAIFTLMVFLVGRSADTLANLPARLFGPIGGVVRSVGIVVSKIVPNLNVYVPARPILLGQVPSMSLPSYLLSAWANAIFYAGVLLVLSAIVFRKRDFQ